MVDAVIQNQFSDMLVNISKAGYEEINSRYDFGTMLLVAL